VTLVWYKNEDSGAPDIYRMNLAMFNPDTGLVAHDNVILDCVEQDPQ